MDGDSEHEGDVPEPPTRRGARRAVRRAAPLLLAGAVVCVGALGAGLYLDRAGPFAAGPEVNPATLTPDGDRTAKAVDVTITGGISTITGPIADAVTFVDGLSFAGSPDAGSIDFNPAQAETNQEL